MSLHIVKSLKRSLVLASAALVIHVGVATAASADAAPDAQELARQLLLGSNRPSAAGAQAIKPEAMRATGEPERLKRPTAYRDPQAAAQQLLLGQHETSQVSATVGTESARHSVVYGDAQLAARQMLSGEHLGSEAWPRTARATP